MKVRMDLEDEDDTSCEVRTSGITADTLVDISIGCMVGLGFSAATVRDALETWLDEHPVVSSG